MLNSNLGEIVKYDVLINDVIKNWPEQACHFLMAEYQRSTNREAFAAALIGYLCVKHCAKGAV